MGSLSEFQLFYSKIGQNKTSDETLTVYDVGQIKNFYNIIFIGLIEYLEGFNVDGREEGAEKERGASSATHVSLSEKYRISAL